MPTITILPSNGHACKECGIEDVTVRQYATFSEHLCMECASRELEFEEYHYVSCLASDHPDRIAFDNGTSMAYIMDSLRKQFAASL